MKRKVKDISDPFADDLANFSTVADSLWPKASEKTSSFVASSAKVMNSVFSSQLETTSSGGSNAPNISVHGSGPIGHRDRQLRAESSLGLTVGVEGMGRGPVAGRRGVGAPSASPSTLSTVLASSPPLIPRSDSNTIGTVLQGRRAEVQGGQPRSDGGGVAHQSRFSSTFGAVSPSPLFSSSSDGSAQRGGNAAQTPFNLWESPSPTPPTSSTANKEMPPREPSEDLPWLSDSLSMKVSAGPRSPPRGFQPGGMGVETSSRAPPSNSIPVSDASSLPFFLQDNDKERQNTVEQKSRQETITVQNSAPSIVVEAPTSIPQWVVKKKKLEEEEKNLYSDLEAIELEIEMLDKKMDLQRIKDEAELLQLDTEVIISHEKLLQAEEDVKMKYEEMKAFKAEMTEKNDRRYERELGDIKENVLSGERSKYQLRLKRLQEMVEEIQRSVTALQNQKALLSLRHPFDKRNILARLALDDKDMSELRDSPSSISEQSPPPSGIISKDRISMNNKDSSKTEDKSGGEKGEGGYEQVQSYIRKALEIIKDYCDDYCRGLRSGIIDVIHRETEQAAHQVRLMRESSWISTMTDRKSELATYKAQSLEEYLAFFRRREDEKAKNIKYVHEMIKSECEKLRLAARERLSQAVYHVEAKIKYEQANYEKKVQEALAFQKERETKSNLMDKEWKQIKMEELRTRCQTEMVVRKKLFLAEKETLEKQCKNFTNSRMRDQSCGFLKLKDEAKANVHESIRNVQDVVLELKNHLESQFLQHKGNKEVKFPLSSTALSAKMKVEELRETVRAVQQMTEAEHHHCEIKTKRVEALLCQGASLLSRLLELLREKRTQQHSHEQELSFQCKLWEREHRKALESPHLVHMSPCPSTGSDVMSSEEDTLHSSRGVDVTAPPVYTDPTRVMVTSYLQALDKKLHAYFNSNQNLRKKRNQLRHSPREIMNSMRQHHLYVNQAWANVLEATLQLEEALEAKGKYEAIMMVQQDRVKQEVQALNLEEEKLLKQKETMDLRSSKRQIPFQ